MDSVPFTLSFVVFILGFEENMVHLCVAGNPIDLQWPKECMGLNYCHIRPNDYPSDAYLTKLFIGAEIDVPPAPAFNETEDRDGNICRIFKTWAESIYMIKDEQNNIKYALNVPKVYTFQVETEPCHAADQTLEEYGNKIKCEQRFTEFPLIVLNEQLNKLQSSKLKLPTSCAPVYLDYDY